MYDKGKSIHFFFVYQNIQFHKLAALISAEFVIQRSIASGTGFQCIKEIVDDLVERQVVFQKRTGLLNIVHTIVNATALLAKIHNGTDKFSCYHDLGIYHWFFHVFNL